VTPDRPAQEAIQDAHRYLADPHGPQRHEIGEEAGGTADVLDGTTGRRSGGNGRRARGAG
jgi:hypothetical protein